MQPTMTADIDGADLLVLADTLSQFQAAVEEYERLGALVEAALSQREGDRPDSPFRSRVVPASNVFTCEGEVWTIVYAGTTIQFKDAKGLHDLRQLLLNPGQPIHVRQLLGTDTRATGADPVLDDRAKASYRTRLAELDRELDEAEANHDVARAEQFRYERDTLIDELSRAAGVGGRDRRLGDDTERARKTVWARIRHAIARIDERHPALGDHLGAAVSTGVYCCYESSDPVQWC